MSFVNFGLKQIVQGKGFLRSYPPSSVWQWDTRMLTVPHAKEDDQPSLALPEMRASTDVGVQLGK